MISNTAIDAIEACKQVLIDVVVDELKKTPGNRTDMGIYFLNQYDGDPEIDLITCVYLKDDRVYVDYEDAYESIGAEPIESFTVDEISSIIDGL